ncbi:hypothetical protein, variant 1 [Aphanomyces invadans]|uniref:Transmembrane protein n=1 Tax=Aphanomyces invadans TaxID=157072 RepID=A0A024TWJ1_9STRA|nr:hypothetical protein, variant 1 [Aphanomyces invadans]ETV98378.1 hypothetical protein, variant 1 [Aphanomyces invadans]|eukprot:XP_008873253.1 hypothetical protein, variant 1 [Aphanomyces invadans]
MSLSPKNSAPNSLDATMEALAVQQSEAVDTADPPRLAPSNQSLLGPPSALHIDTNEPEDVEVAHSRLMMRLSSGGKRAVGGVFACSLSLVNDGSESRLWAQSYFRFLAQTCFDLSPSAVEGLLPVVQSERSRSPATTNSATASLDEMPIDSGPFVALIETELSHDEIVQLFCYVLWRTTHAVGYDARTRAMFRIACRQFHNISWTVIGAEEVVLARALLLEATELQSTKKVQSPRKWTDWRRNLAIGGAAVAGGTLLALTGGLATPLVAAGFSALGGAGAVIGTALASSGAVTAATVLFGTAGAGLAGYKTDRRTLGIKQFEFQLLTPGDGMHVYVCVAGWLEEDNAADFSNAFGTPREYLRAFYAQFCPEKLGLVDSMLERYKGREDELFAMLRKQYNLPLDQDPVRNRSLWSPPLSSELSVGDGPTGAGASNGWQAVHGAVASPAACVAVEASNAIRRPVQFVLGKGRARSVRKEHAHVYKRDDIELRPRRDHSAHNICRAVCRRRASQVRHQPVQHDRFRVGDGHGPSRYVWRSPCEDVDGAPARVTTGLARWVWHGRSVDLFLFEAFGGSRGRRPWHH